MLGFDVMSNQTKSIPLGIIKFIEKSVLQLAQAILFFLLLFGEHISPF
jgi:hypothetical protein